MHSLLRGEKKARRDPQQPPPVQACSASSSSLLDKGQSIIIALPEYSKASSEPFFPIPHHIARLGGQIHQNLHWYPVSQTGITGWPIHFKQVHSLTLRPGRLGCQIHHIQSRKQGGRFFPRMCVAWLSFPSIQVAKSTKISHFISATAWPIILREVQHFGAPSPYLKFSKSSGAIVPAPTGGRIRPNLAFIHSISESRWRWHRILLRKRISGDEVEEGCQGSHRGQAAPSGRKKMITELVPRGATWSAWCEPTVRM